MEPKQNHDLMSLIGRQTVTVDMLQSRIKELLAEIAQLKVENAELKKIQKET